MIYGIRLENDEGHYTLLLEDSFGTHMYHVDPDMLVEACGPYLAHLAEGEAVRAEYEASGRMSWDAYRASQARTDPEYIEALAVSGDLLRKQEKENR